MLCFQSAFHWFEIPEIGIFVMGKFSCSDINLVQVFLVDFTEVHKRSI